MTLFTSKQIHAFSLNTVKLIKIDSILHAKKKKKIKQTNEQKLHIFETLDQAGKGNHRRYPAQKLRMRTVITPECELY